MNNLASVPFCTVNAGAFDLSDYIISFQYVQSTEQLDVLTLQLYDVDQALLERPELKEGKLLTFIWGFLGESVSDKHRTRIASIMPEYTQNLSLRLQAVDLGIDLKKNSSNKTFTKIKSSDIATQIAGAYGLEADVEPTSTTHELLAQGNRSDYEFLKYLVEREDDGDYIFYTRQDKLVFKRRDLSSESQRTYEWGKADGTLLSFRPQSNEVQKEMAAQTAQVVAQDPLEGVNLNFEVSEDNAKNNQKLGKKTVVFNQNGERAGTTTQSKPKKTSVPEAANPISERSGRNIVQPAASQKIAENLAHSIKKRNQMHDMTATLTMIGDPTFSPDSIITMAGVARQHQGNFYAHQVEHSLRPRDTYRLTVQCFKNAADESPADPVGGGAIVNKSTGTPDEQQPRVPQKKIKVRAFDVNGNEVS